MATRASMPNQLRNDIRVPNLELLLNSRISSRGMAMQIQRTRAAWANCGDG